MSSNNESLRGKTTLVDNNPQAPDVLSTASGGTRLNLSLAVPELSGKSIPASPSTGGKRKTSHGKVSLFLFVFFFCLFGQVRIPSRRMKKEKVEEKSKDVGGMRKDK